MFIKIKNVDIKNNEFEVIKETKFYYFINFDNRLIRINKKRCLKIKK